MTLPVVLPNYGRYDLAFERGEGAWLYTAEGRRFLDFGAGIAVCSLGHAHPALVKALQEQAAKLWHTSNLYHIPGQQKVAQMLVDHSFADTVFFCNSGAEANEGALKMARRFHQSQDSAEAQQRYRVMVCTNAFHGRTLATLAAGGSDKYRQGFAPNTEGFDRVPFGNLNEARAAVTAQTAAILVEPIQGEGGICPADVQYLHGLRAMADEYGLLLIFDEVQTGIGRTGRLFSHQWSDMVPDILTSAKGLGGGFPVAAILASERAAACMGPGTHGTTYGGNPLAMACAGAVLETVLAEGFLEGVQQASALLMSGLQKIAARYPHLISEVRGQGLMIGLKCVAEGGNGALVKALMDRDMLTVPAGDNVVRLLPPLIIGEAEITLALTILDATLSALSQG
jgi:acetylornithine/N-succinyldiaminopimelate aminotransferase